MLLRLRQVVFLTLLGTALVLGGLSLTVGGETSVAEAPVAGELQAPCEGGGSGDCQPAVIVALGPILAQPWTRELLGPTTGITVADRIIDRQTPPPKA